MSGFEGLSALASGALFGAPEYLGAPALTGGLLTGGMGGMDLLGAGLGLMGASGATKGNPQTGIPQLLASRALSTLPTSTVNAGPAVRTPDYSSMAGPTMADFTRLEEVGGAIPPPQYGGTMAMPAPGTPTGPIPQPPVQPNPIASAVGAGADAYLKMREVAAREAEVNKPFAIAPNIRPGAPVPIAVGKPLAAGSPLQKYAMMLRRFG